MPPPSPTATHSAVEAHETRVSRSSLPTDSGRASFQLGCTAPGLVDTYRPPSASITHRDVVGQTTFWIEPKLASDTFHVEAEPVGSVEIAIRARSPLPPA